GFNISAQGGTSDNVKLGETVDYANTDGNIEITAGADNQINYNLADDITVTSVTAGDSKLDSNGLTVTGGPSVTKSGIDAANTKVINVAAGTDATDAVNKGQLDALSTSSNNKTDA
ncbi:adhesin, partial [Acinetobacter lactucae]|nr:adhesin [Acinetobacter lactucae]